MSFLNLISFFGIFGLCAIAWLFSEHKRVIPWRVIIFGIGLQLILGFLVFQFPVTRFILDSFSRLLDAVFVAADFGARFVFGPALIPRIGEAPTPGIGTIFAFRVLPPVIFFSGLMALLYNIGVIQPVINFFAKVFYATMRLSGAEALSGSANIFVGIEAAIVVKPFLAKMTRSELCAILSCCFGTAASSTLIIYVKALENVFPNILVHLVSASIIAIPACFVLSKILVPETEVPLTAGGIPQEEKIQDKKDEEVVESDFQDAPKETVAGEPIERVSPVDAAIVGALDGVKMAVAIAAVLILILGLVSLINQLFGGLASLQNSDIFVFQLIGKFFSVVTLQNILGALFLPLTILTGVSVEWDELWRSSVIIGRRLFETAIPPYQTLGQDAAQGLLSDRAVLIISYALSGFAHLASVGIFVGGTIALIPSRRKDISELGWKALFVGTLATMMIACIAGVFDTGDASILGEKTAPTAPITAPTPTTSPTVPTVTPSPTLTPIAPVVPPPIPVTPQPSPQTTVSPIPTTPSPTASPLQANPRPTPPTTPRPTPQATASPTPTTPRPTPRTTTSPTPTTPRPTPQATASPTPTTPNPTPQATTSPTPATPQTIATPSPSPQ
ncbi:nucleoside:proton symporter [Microcoleus sp. FACHB-SPT15]|uniref:NupC/NupG family nucleoside CNT transporter n=1 Tax=Microcoleus sp. FACHB-SPT15 TaxID=2692830 RepID=UPI0017813FD8|nr:nucleoside transporter C-terminal domain-containing protein [Microcoleus sp. FACHB-SPT15]MBD1806969.1 nucleoside:proton symporter [Microcoleus sp. FACHB-SPT15]